jgi:hypothetical protein
LIDTLLGDRPSDDWHTYTPVLRAKTSEWKALAALSSGVRRRIAPIIEFVPYWKEPGASASSRKRRAPQTPAAYLNRFLESCVNATPASTRSFVYFGLAGSDAKWSGIDLWSEFEAQASPAVHLVPLVDLDSVGVSAAFSRVVQSRAILGLRVDSDDIGPALASRISGALGMLGVAPSSAHIVVDLKDIPSAVTHEQVREAIGLADSFASVVVIAGVFPRDLTDYQPGITPEARREWHIWWSEHLATPAGKRMLSYGDYTTQCARYEPPPEVPGSVSLRYTTDDAILVLRGRQSNGNSGLGHEQMHGHCRLLINRPDYDGAAFSEGDHRVFCWTSPVNGTGNAMQWRAAAIVHHITHVVAQLQDPLGSSSNARAWARSRAPTACS